MSLNGEEYVANEAARMEDGIQFMEYSSACIIYSQTLIFCDKTFVSCLGDDGIFTESLYLSSLERSIERMN